MKTKTTTMTTKTTTTTTTMKTITTKMMTTENYDNRALLSLQLPWQVLMDVRQEGFAAPPPLIL